MKQGFSLIELMIVVAIIAFLAMVSMPTFSKFLAKAKRSEAHMQLSSIYTAQKAYWAEHGRYALALTGPDSLNWTPEGYHGGGESESFYYSYGFGSGSEGVNFVTGKLNTPSSYLHGAYADQNRFLVYAAGDIDGDGTPDILTIDHNHVIQLVQDDLAN